ncbi:IS630 family transposase, partial [Corallococcus llansteffanensis]
WPEYNLLYAHPFTWLWTRAKMHDWFERHRR